MDVQRAMEIENEVMRRAMDAGKPSAASDCYPSSLLAIGPPLVRPDRTNGGLCPFMVP